MLMRNGAVNLSDLQATDRLLVYPHCTEHSVCMCLAVVVVLQFWDGSMYATVFKALSCLVVLGLCRWSSWLVLLQFKPLTSGDHLFCISIPLVDL